MDIKEFYDKIIAEDDHFEYCTTYDYSTKKEKIMEPEWPYSSKDNKKLCWYNALNGARIVLKYNSKEYEISYSLCEKCAGNVKNLKTNHIYPFASSEELIRILKKDLKLKKDEEVAIAELDDCSSCPPSTKALVTYDSAPVLKMTIIQTEPSTSKRNVYTKYFIKPEELADIHKTIIEDFVPLQLFCRVNNK